MKIAKDKLLHVAACGVASAVTAMVAVMCGCAAIGAAAVGCMSGTVCGLGKEYGDKMCAKNRWDWVDVAADVTGAVVGAAVGVLIGKLVV